MDVDVVTRLRRVLACTRWPGQAREVVDALVAETVMARGLVVVGTTGYAPVHLAEHLTEVAQRRDDDRLLPRLDAEAAGLHHLAEVGAGESVLVVATGPVAADLAQELRAARDRDACVTSIDLGDDDVLAEVAHARLRLRLRCSGRPAEPVTDALPLEIAEHLVASLLLHRDDPPGLVQRVRESLGALR